jgi:hypothetical protein
VSASPQDYADALAEFHSAAKELAGLLYTLGEFVGKAERDAEAVCFVGLGNEPSPPLSQLAYGASWDAERFPTPVVLQAALRKRLLARARAVRLYEALTTAQRKTAPHVPK